VGGAPSMMDGEGGREGEGRRFKKQKWVLRMDVF